MTGAIATPQGGLFDLLFGRARAEAVAAPAVPALDPEAAAMIQDGAALFKALGHEGRLLILCCLLAGERSVTEIETILDARQSAVSQQLARLRMEGIVATRREGQMIFYSIRDPRVLRLLRGLDAVLSPGPDDAPAA